MKQVLGIVLLCLILLESTSRVEAGQGVNFEKGLNWQQVKAKAKAENKYIFIDVFASWCGPCKLMDREVYPRDSVGDFMNGKFISVKIQADSTVRDDFEVRKWYSDAHSIAREYTVSAYPTFLFLTPEGKLVYKSVGVSSQGLVAGFIEMAKKALDPANAMYYSKLEEYKAGKKDATILGPLARYASATDPTLAKQIAADYIANRKMEGLLNVDDIMFVRTVKKDQELAKHLAVEFVDSVLDKLNSNDLFTNKNLQIVNLYWSVINSKDSVFQEIYRDPERADSAFGFKGFSKGILEQVIAREEIKDKLFQNGVVVEKYPDWNAMITIIKSKYPKMNAGEIVLNSQILFYKKLEDWRRWSDYQDEKIKKGVAAGKWPREIDVYVALNLPAWDAFLHCIDTVVLARALSWSELAIRLDSLTPNMSCLDTRANLLYKLGKRKEAIEQEEGAISLSDSVGRVKGKEAGPFKDLFMKVVTAMKAGQPTYLDQGAVWNDAILRQDR